MLSFKEYKKQKQIQESIELQHPVKDLEEKILMKYPEVETLRLHSSGKHDIKLDTLIVKKDHRKEGIGSKVLHDLKTYADKNSKRIILTAGVRDSAVGTTSQSRLDKFYKKNGFVANKGRYKDYAITATHYYSGKGHISESVEHPMIDVDGEMRHRMNSEGQPIHPSDEGIRNFHRWFAGSDVVDEHGRPKVLYHGTNEDFSDFDFDKSRESGHVWASNDPKVASNFALYRTVWNNANVMPVYVHAKKIKTIDGGYRNIRDVDSELHDAKSDASYDAVHIKNVRDPVNPYSTDPFGDVWAFKKTARIKSALGNTGAFSHPSNISESFEHPMIEVDGEMKHRHNSLGQLIHPTDEGIRNFHRWFGNSETVDAHGRPKVFYHGTSSDIPEFDMKFVGHGNDALGSGFYFISSPEAAGLYTTADRSEIPGTGNAANIIPTYIKMDKSIKHDDDSSLSVHHITAMINSSPDIEDSLSNFGDVDYEGKQKVMRRAVNSYKELPKLHAMNTLANDFYPEDTETFLRNFKKHTGYGGVTKVDGANTTIVAFDPSQIKSAIGNSGAFAHPTKINESEDYMGSHTAPTEEDAPAHDLTRLMPEDVYSSNASRYYSTGFSDSEDRNVFSMLHSIRNKPSAKITIYRAIPKAESRDAAITKLEKHKASILKNGKFPSGVDSSQFKNPSEYYDWAYDEINRLKELPAEENIKKTINKGDWVTLSREYAKQHGESSLGGHYRILSKSARADEVFTNGDSIHEWGYHPKQ